MEFLDVPDSYYDMLRNRLKASGTKIVEDLDILQVLLLIVNLTLIQVATRLLSIRLRYRFVEIKDTNRLRREWISSTNIHEKYARSANAVHRSHTEAQP